MNDKDIIRKLVFLLNEYKSKLVLIFFCLLISTGLNLCIPLISKKIMDEGFIGGNKKILLNLILCSFIIYMLISILNLIKEKIRVGISAKIQYSLWHQAFTHLMRMKINHFNDRNGAEILSNISVDIANMVTVADESVFFVITQAFSMAGGVIGLFILDYRMTLLVLLFIPVKAVIMKYFAKHRKAVMDEFIFDSEQYAKWFGDTVGGVKEIRLFGIFENKKSEFIAKQTEVIKKQKKMNMLSQWNSITDTMLVQLLAAVIYIVGSNLVFNLQLSIGSVFAFITYSTYVTGPISAILNIGYLLSGIIPSTKRFYQFMDLEEEGKRADYPTRPQNGDIELEDVSFAYNREKTVVDHISFRINQGDKIVFIGKNGSGKSTLINLLLRMYEPSDGRILLAGQNIADMPLDAYRSMISVVSQEIYLFNDTIRNNICLYKQVDDNAILSICRDSGLEDFLNEVSLDYSVGQNGIMLSGGQKQKIALARALLHDRPIVVFDEATSSTDSYSEQQINSLLHTKLKDKTVVVITHRQEILSEADYIVMLHEGKIVEQGNYEYIKNCRQYLDMVNIDQ
ncbi:MAG: ABC transporter ATP-binding protein/permease [Lachnospiraceae bacterium]|nr:ABC transporter ATP-binding protein/permease [Lachnospiraceae bacterium]